MARIKFSLWPKAQPNWKAMLGPLAVGFALEVNDNNIIKSGITPSTPIPTVQQIIADGSLLARVQWCVASGHWQDMPVKFAFLDCESTGGNDGNGIARKKTLYDNTIAAYDQLRAGHPELPVLKWSVYCGTLDDDWYDNADDAGGVNAIDAAYLSVDVADRLDGIDIEGYSWKGAGENESQEAAWLNRETKYVNHAKQFGKPVGVFIEPYVGDNVKESDSQAYVYYKCKQIDALVGDNGYIIPWNGMDENSDYDATTPFMKGFLQWANEKVAGGPITDPGDGSTTVPPVVTPPPTNPAPAPDYAVRMDASVVAIGNTKYVPYAMASAAIGAPPGFVPNGPTAFEAWGTPAAGLIPVYRSNSGDGRYALHSDLLNEGPGWLADKTPLCYIAAKPATGLVAVHAFILSGGGLDTYLAYGTGTPPTGYRLGGVLGYAAVDSGEPGPVDPPASGRDDQVTSLLQQALKLMNPS